MCIVSWSWVLCIGLLSLIIQLEITHFNFWSAVTLVLFILLVITAIKRRTIYVDNNKLFLGRMFYHFDTVDLAQLKDVVFTKHQIKFTLNGERYQYYVGAAVLDQLRRQLNN
ncbi:hypothetical protein EQG49_12355 [Periweissella cryptocerci]|uniref:Pore-forming protein n=2 Tax=Periweissella cryptocerci TaxID=2506420 RepID=A0A4P6YWI1_9LACO|nr:hypothetical protein EQG49_12355 [Periweissella cryptocerci]